MLVKVFCDMKTIEPQNINKVTSSGVKWISVFTLLNIIVNPVMLIFLSGFLEPGEFGLHSILAVIITLANALSQFGIAQAIIQKEEVTNKELSSLFWGNCND